MNKGRGFQNGWWLVLITLGVMLTASVPFMITNNPDNDFMYMLFSEVSLIIPLLLGFFFLNLEQPEGGIISGMGLKGFSVRLLPFVLLLPIAGQSFANYIASPLQIILSLLFGVNEYQFLSGAEEFWQNVILMCILAPLFEELLCRGVLMLLFKRYGTAKMLVYSSLGFALLHLDAQSIIPLFFVGLILGVIRMTTGSVMASVAAHAVSNLYALIMLTFNPISVVNTLIVVLTAMAFPFLVWFYIKACDRKFYCREQFTSIAAPTGFSVGFVLVIALFGITNMAIFLSRLISGDIFYDLSSMFMY